MAKKTTLTIAGLTAAIALTAFGYEAVSQKPTDADLSSGQSARPLQLYELGKTHTTRHRAPDGGYTAPVTFAPTQEQFAECSILDLNEDNKTWTFTNNSFTYTYSTANAANDWCMLPAVNCNAGKCKISFSYKNANSSYPESFKVFVGDAATVEAMTIPVAERINFTNKEYATAEAMVELPHAGEWHVGLYACSDADKYKFHIKDVSIVVLDDNQPMPPVITIDTEGLDCGVTVTMPTENLAGLPLEAASLDAKVYLDGNLMEGGEFSAAPGESKTLRTILPTSGNHTFTATASFESDGKTLTSTEATVSQVFTKKQPVPTPTGYVFEPDADEFSWCTVIDSNGDNTTWSHADSGMPTDGAVSSNAFRYSYSYSQTGDDWLILPVFDGSTGGAHQLNFNLASKYDEESMQICVATEPTVEALSQNVIWDQSFKLDNTFQAQKALFTVEEGKDYYIAFHATSPAYRSFIFIQNVYVSKVNGEAPARPALSDPVFDGGDGTVTLTMPSDNLDGNALTADKVYAEVTVDGQTYGSVPEAAPGETVTLNFNGLALGSHRVEAKAYILDGDEKVYSEAASISFKTTMSSSFAYSLPLDLDLNTSTFEYFVAFNENNDDKEWEGATDWFELSYHGTNSADDWIISPAVDFSEAGNYEIVLTARNSSSSYAEKVALSIGRERTVAGMTTEVLPVTELTSGEWQNLTKIVSIDEPGRYFVGIHGVSDPNKLRLQVSHLAISKSNINALSPAAVEDLAAEGFETGELKADVSFTFPVKNFSGNDIDINTDLTATVTSASETKTVSGKPGSQGALQIACPEGTSEIRVVISNTEGESPAAVTGVNCGLDTPKAPVLTALTYSEDNLSATIHFEPVTEGVNGGHVNAGHIDYYLFEWDEDDQDWYQVDVEENVTSFTYSVPAGSSQELITLGVQCYNGLNSGSSIESFSVTLGEPVALPIRENFENGQLHHSIAVGSSSYYAPEWSLVKPENVIAEAVSTDGGYALYGETNSYYPTSSFIYLPKFSTEDIYNPTLQLISYKHTAGCEITVYASSHDSAEPEAIGTIEIPASNEGWADVSFPLPETLKNHKWVEIYFHVNFTQGSSSVPLIDAYRMLTNDPNAIDGIADDAASRYVRGGKGAIAIAGYAGEEVNVCNLAGQTVSNGNAAEGVHYVIVEPGVYVVKAGTDSYKVLVK